MCRDMTAQERAVVRVALIAGMIAKLSGEGLTPVIQSVERDVDAFLDGKRGIDLSDQVIQVVSVLRLATNVSG